MFPQQGDTCFLRREIHLSRRKNELWLNHPLPRQPDSSDHSLLPAVPRSVPLPPSNPHYLSISTPSTTRSTKTTPIMSPLAPSSPALEPTATPPDGVGDTDIPKRLPKINAYFCHRGAPDLPLRKSHSASALGGGHGGGAGGGSSGSLRSLRINKSIWEDCAVSASGDLLVHGSTGSVGLLVSVEIRVWWSKGVVGRGRRCGGGRRRRREREDGSSRGALRTAAQGGSWRGGMHKK